MIWKTCTLFVVALILSGTSYLALAGDKAADSKKLKGTWNATWDTKKAQMNFDGNKFTLQLDKISISGTFTIDPTQKPKSIDILITDSSDELLKKDKGKTGKGIYELDGNKLKWCANNPGADKRPEAFPENGAKAKDSTLFLVFQRKTK